MSIKGFSSKQWMIRNCSTLLLSAIVLRIFGPSRMKEGGGTLSKKNRYDNQSTLLILHSYFSSILVWQVANFSINIHHCLNSFWMNSKMELGEIVTANVLSSTFSLFKNLFQQSYIIVLSFIRYFINITTIVSESTRRNWLCSYARQIDSICYQVRRSFNTFKKLHYYLTE